MIFLDRTKMTNKYENGKIYKITNDINAIVYIGSTTKKYLSDRMSGHRYSAKQGTTPFMRTMQEIGTGHFQIELIKLYSCSSRIELEKEEYATMKKYKRDGVELYNTSVHRGSICKDRGMWRFMWRVDGKQQKISFPFKKWGGEWGAKKMAILWQNMIYPE